MRDSELTMLRRTAVEVLQREGSAAVISNAIGGLTISATAAEAVAQFIGQSAGGWDMNDSNVWHLETCACTRSIPALGVRFRLCSRHRAAVTRLLKAAKINIDVIARVRKRKRPRKHRDVFAVGVVVSGGLPSLGKRR